MPLVITTKKIEIETPLNIMIRLLGESDNDEGFGITTDSSGNIYVIGYTYKYSGEREGGDTSTYGNNLLLAKYNSSVIIQWQRVLGGSDYDEGFGITTDSSDNVYVTGRTYSQTSGGSDLLFAKYNSSGTIQWQQILSGNDSGSGIGRGITADSSGDIYVIGSTTSQGAGTYDLLLAKYNSSGTIQWQRVLGGNNVDIGVGITADSSGDIYVIGSTNRQGAGSDDLLLAKYNSSGTIQWQRVLGGSDNNEGFGITTDSSGNIYVIGYTYGNNLLLAKYNSSGTIQWQRVLGGSGNDEGIGITADSSGNIYVTGYTESQGAGGNDLLIVKYNSSGTIQWQRVLGGSGTDIGYGITTDSSGNIYVTGYTESQGAGGNDLLLAKLPNDGSGLGTYGNFIYQESTLTSATSTLTANTSTLTAATSTLTANTSTLTAATSTLTETVVI